MIQEFLTIEEAAKRLEARGYTPKKVLSLVTAKQVPHHVRGGKVLIPFPEADPCFPPLDGEAPADPAPDVEPGKPGDSDEEKPAKGSKKGK